MPVPQPRVSPDDDLVVAGLEKILVELDLDLDFPAAAVAEARSLEIRDPTPRCDRLDLALVTIDPPGASDLDQALAVERHGDGHVVWYAIADVASLVPPGGAIAAESHARGVTLYAPHRRIPLHPTELSENAGSLLPDRDRPAVLWRFQLDSAGEMVDVAVERATVRSRRQLSYAEAQALIDAGDDDLAPLRTVGDQRLAIERQRGGLSLPVPEQEVVAADGRYDLEFRATLPVEEWNAQISLLCGMAAAGIMLEAGWGLLRTLPPSTERARKMLRRHAAALGVAWGDDETYGDVVERLDTTRGGDAAFAVQATRLFRGAGYLPLRPDDGPLPSDETIHAAIAAPYAHVTAPLRRLGDRFATEAVLAATTGDDPPDWVVTALDGLPSTLQSSSSRANNLERTSVDYLEALILAGRVGSTFEAVVVDRGDGESEVQFVDPAVVASVEGEHPLGETIEVRVEGADPGARRLELSVVS